MNSPLGKYSQIVAAITAVGVIFGYLSGVLFGVIGADSIKDFALIALGAVFGSAATVNGVKHDIRAANTRLDAMHAPPAPVAEKIVEAETRL